jgi:predicted CoA-substrate-specific enzyme activase
MNNGKTLAGLDAGHVNTKAVIMRGQEILGYSTAPTGFDVVAAAQTALQHALDSSGVARGELAGIVATGIFRDMVKAPQLDVTATVPDYVADVKGALFLNKNSRTVIDIGGNVHKAMHFDKNGDLLDVIQNDKCADGLGIFYTTMAKALGLSEQGLSELALKSTRNVSVAIQCALSAESEAIDLMCQGVETADVADAVSRFIVERVAAMCTYMPLTKEIMVAGGLARSQALVNHLQSSIKRDVSVVGLPEYVGAIGVVMSYGGGK